MENKLRQLQLIEFELLKEFKSICEANQLTYYISGGTFLGAIRHKGFIPWDDDVDVAMPRKDYERFLKIAPELMKNQSAVMHYTIEKESKRPYIRLINRSVQVRNKSWQVSKIEPAWIDVFPLDGMPSSYFRVTIHKVHLLYRKVMVGFANYEYVQDNKPNRPWYEKALMALNNITGFGKHLDLYKQYDKLENTLRRYSDGKSKVYFNFHGAYR